MKWFYQSEEEKGFLYWNKEQVLVAILLSAFGSYICFEVFVGPTNRMLYSFPNNRAEWRIFCVLFLYLHWFVCNLMNTRQDTKPYHRCVNFSLLFSSLIIEFHDPFHVIYAFDAIRISFDAILSVLYIDFKSKHLDNNELNWFVIRFPFI